LNTPAPSLILCERSGRWASSLRRHGLVDRLRLVEARSLAELDTLLGSVPHALAGVELSSTTVESGLAWLARRPATMEARIIVFAQRALRTYEAFCREAGAIHFVVSELELFSLGPLFDRYRSQPAFAKLDEAELTLADRVRARMRW
jgi:hypothetical protein